MNTTQCVTAARTQLFRLATGITALALLAGCASTGTGEKIAKQSGSSSVRNLGVAVVVRKNLEVLNATEDSASLGAVLGHLISGVPGLLVGDEIQQGARRARDARTADPMRPHMTAADYRQRAEAKLAEVLRQSGKFQSVQIAGASSEPACDAVLTVEVEQWGVRPSPVATGKDKPMEVWHMVSYKLTRAGNKAVLWHDRQLFLSGKERTLAEYQNSPATLVNDLQSSLDRYCGLIANQLIY